MDKPSEKVLSRKVKINIKSISPIVALIVFCILLICVFVYLIIFSSRAKTLGSAIGENSGVLAGRAVGSLEGLTKGQIEGFEAGKEEGLRAKDTTAELATKIQEVERLEVLVASGTYSDVLSIGENPINYAALLSQKYNASFTVDLGTAEIELKNDGLYILLDQPMVEFVPIGDIEKKNEYQRKKFSFKLHRSLLHFFIILISFR